MFCLQGQSRELGYYPYSKCQMYSHHLKTTWKEFNENTKLHLQQAVGKM